MAQPDQPVTDTEDLTPTTVDLTDGDPDAESGDDGAQPPTDPTDSQPAAAGLPQKAQPGTPGARPSRAPRPSRLNHDQITGLSGQIQTLTQTVQQQQAIIQQLMTSAGQQGGGGQQQERQSGPEGQIQQLVKEQHEIMQIVRAGNLSAEQANSLSTRYQSLEDQRNELKVQAMIERAIAPLAERGQGSGDPKVNHARGVLELEFPEVMGDDGAMREAQNYHAYLVSQGRADGIGLLREAAAHVARRRGLGGGRLGPSGASQAARSGVPNGATAPDESTITFDKGAMRQIRGAGVSPEQIAAEWVRQRRGA